MSQLVNADTLVQLPTPRVALPSGASRFGSHQMGAILSGCERKYALRYVAKAVPNFEPPFRLVGSLVHMCLAYHYGSMLEPRPAFMATALSDALDALERGQAPETKLTAVRVAAAYAQRFHADTWVPLYVEQEFEATVGELDPQPTPQPEDDVVISCRPDLVIGNNGKVFIVDHKCSSGEYNKPQLGSWKADGEYRMHWQAMVYMHIMRKRLGAVEGFIIQRIKRKAPFDFARHVLPLPALPYTQTPAAIRRAVRKDLELRARLAAGDVSVPSFSDCFGRYGACDYANVCAVDSRREQDQVLALEFHTLP